MLQVVDGHPWAVLATFEVFSELCLLVDCFLVQLALFLTMLLAPLHDPGREHPTKNVTRRTTLADRAVWGFHLVDLELEPTIRIRQHGLPVLPGELLDQLRVEPSERDVVRSLDIPPGI